VRQRARVLDVRGGDLELLGEVRDEADDPCEQALDVPCQRLQLARLLDDVRHALDLGDQVRLVGDVADDSDPLEAGDEDPERPVGDLHHLLDRRDRPDLVQVVPAGLLDVVLHRHEGEQALVARDDVVDELDRALLPDRERRPRVREDDGLLQREDRELVRDGRRRCRRPRRLGGDLGHGRVFTSIGTLTPLGVRFASGSTIVRSPRA
jgi:hypothetical protein